MCVPVIKFSIHWQYAWNSEECSTILGHSDTTFYYKSYLHNNKTDIRTQHIQITDITKHLSSLIWTFCMWWNRDFTVIGTGSLDVRCFLNLAFKNRYILSGEPYLWNFSWSGLNSVRWNHRNVPEPQYHQVFHFFRQGLPHIHKNIIML